MSNEKQQFLTLDPLAQSLLRILHVSMLIVEIDFSLLSIRWSHTGKRITVSLDTLILDIRLLSVFNEIANMFLLLEPLTFIDSNQARRKSVTSWVEKCDQINMYLTFAVGNRHRAIDGTIVSTPEINYWMHPSPLKSTVPWRNKILKN